MRLLLLSIFIVSVISGFGQEINCQVSVIAPKLQSNPANQETMESLQSSVFEFVNSTKWTTDNFADEERIECSILINVSEKIGSDGYKGSIQISSSRPVFNSNYSSRLFNYSDDQFSFTYLRNSAVVFTPDRHSNNLAEVVAFYMYMVIGYDYDSFSLEGGTPYFTKAQQIVTNCANASEAGWKASEGNRNRYWLVDNHLNNLYKPLRKCMYDYHRLGFDMVYEKRDDGIGAMVDALFELDAIHKARPNSFNVQLFFTAKADEMVNIFKGATPDIKNKVFNLIAKLDPGNISKYNKIKKP